MRHIYTKQGDHGETALYGGTRVAKDAPRIMALGEVDELNATLGMVRSTDAGLLDDTLHLLQNLLFELGAELATPPDSAKRPSQFAANDITQLEALIDQWQATLPPLTTFVLPAGCASCTHLHLARAVCRRAERSVMHLYHHEPATDPLIGSFLNRLSDLLFVMARVANRQAGITDVAWHTRMHDIK